MRLRTQENTEALQGADRCWYRFNVLKCQGCPQTVTLPERQMESLTGVKYGKMQKEVMDLVRCLWMEKSMYDEHAFPQFKFMSRSICCQGGEFFWRVMRTDDSRPVSGSIRELQACMLLVLNNMSVAQQSIFFLPRWPTEFFGSDPLVLVRQSVCAKDWGSRQSGKLR